MTNPHHWRNTALGTAYRQMRSELKGVAVRITRNAADADDIVQLAFLRALHENPSLWTAREEARKPWLYTVVKNAAIDLVRRTRTERRELLSHSNLAADGWTAPFDSPMQDVPTERDIFAALDTLPPSYSAVFRLRCQNLDYREISSRLGIPIATVGSRLHRLIRALRRKLSGAGPSAPFHDA